MATAPREREGNVARREFADIYKGTVALYFDDTNPEKEKAGVR